MNVSVSAGAQIKFKSIETVSGSKRVSLSGHLFVKFSTPQAQGFRYLKATHCCWKSVFIFYYEGGFFVKLSTPQAQGSWHFKVEQIFSTAGTGSWIFESYELLMKKYFCFLGRASFFFKFSTPQARVRGISNLSKFSAAQAQDLRYLNATRCCWKSVFVFWGGAFLSNFHRRRLRVHCISKMSVAVPNEFALLVQGLYFLTTSIVAGTRSATRRIWML